MSNGFCGLVQTFSKPTETKIEQLFETIEDKNEPMKQQLPSFYEKNF